LIAIDGIKWQAGSLPNADARPPLHFAERYG